MCSAALALFGAAGHARIMFDVSSKPLRDLLFLTLIGLIVFLPGLAAIPPIDRDESRYLQATVQMIETGDVIDIRFQDQARHKKPAGSYWAQLAGLAVTGQIDDVKRGERAIWAQRLPSVIGALIAIWATYLCGAALFGRREAFIGAGFLALSASLGLEAHIAKTDAMLAGASAVVLYCVATRKAWPAWLGLAVGMLLKGPILLGVAIVALSTDAVWNRSADRIKSLLKPLPILAALLIAVPWFVAIGLQTDGAFFAEALGRDFGGKIASTQEAHGGLPGYYLLTTSFMFWPGIVAVPVAALFAWRNRTNRDVRIFLAWLVPMWIMLELVPTKLPHYTLVLYPALALLAGAGWVRVVDAGKIRTAGVWIAAIVGVLLAIVATATLWQDVSILWLILIALGLIILALFAGYCLLRGQDKTAFGLAALYLAAIFGGIIAHSSFFNFSPRLVAQLSADMPGGARIVSPDYREPSLVYLTETRTQLLSDELRPGDTLVLNAETLAPDCAVARSSLSGTHYAKGREATVTIYKTDDCAADTLTRWVDTD